MSSPAEIAALISLLRFGRLRASAYAPLVEETGSALAVLQQEGLDQASLFDLHPFEAVVGEVELWQASGIRISTVLDPEYPANLRGLRERPPVIFVSGSLIEPDSRSIAVIGSRSASERGRAGAANVARTLVAGGFTVVSGLAAGIDTAAHAAALEADGRTVAVLGTGLRNVYPAKNARLQEEIAARCAVVSQFLPDDPPSRHSFPRRNALMAGLTLGTVIVEASARSGARIQARLALEYGRPVFMLRDVRGQDWAQELAAHRLVRVIDEVEDLVDVVWAVIDGSPSSLEAAEGAG